MALVLRAPVAAAHDRASRLWASVLAVGGHVLLVATVVTLSGDKLPTLPVAARPMAVRFVSPAQPPAPAQPKSVTAPTVPVVAPPKPVRQPRPAVTPARAAAAPVDAVAAPEPSAAAASVSVPAQPPEPPPIVPARFDAAYLNNPKPTYPPAARRRGETGTVTLRVQVSEDGSAAQVELKVSSGSSSLDLAALEAVARWKFVPARQGDTPVRSWVLVPVGFSLN